MSDLPPEAEIERQLTGFCTYLVQGPPFKEGDTVEIAFKRSKEDVKMEVGWVPLAVTRPSASRDHLRPDERIWGADVVLVRASLSQTGGLPRDSMNQPTDLHDPDAFTLSDVRVIDRSPPHEGRSRRP